MSQNQKTPKKVMYHGIELPLYVLDKQLNDLIWGRSAHASTVVIDFYKKLEIEYEKPKSNVLFAVEKPKNGDKFYFINPFGTVSSTIWADPNDMLLFNLNNVFLTKENAQKQADRNQLLAEIERFACENNEVIDWIDHNQDKYNLRVAREDSNRAVWQVERNQYLQKPSTTYFSSEELATQALEKFIERLDILLD